jgi:hypothetical protein
MSFDAETGSAFLNVLLVAACEITFGETKIIEGIEQVGLAHAIVATDAYDPFRELKRSLAVVLELED